jgi:hypothetical protein
MKVGDLVSLKMKKTQPPQKSIHAIVLDAYTNQDGFQEIEIMMEQGIIRQFHADLFEVISECR